MNHGLGPAIIESFKIKIDDEVMQVKQTEVIDNALKKLFPNKEYQTEEKAYLAKGYAMLAKERLTILDIRFKGASTPSFKEIENTFHRAELII